MNASIHHPILRRLFLALLPVLLAAPVYAQPGKQLDKQAELEQLRSQMKSLTQQLEKMQTEDTPQNQRVKSLGNQRLRPQQRESMEIYQIRMYDLSDLFVISPNYPAQFADDLTQQPDLVFDNRPGNFIAGSGGFGSGGGAGGGFGGQGGFGGGGGGGVFNMAPQPRQFGSGKVAVSAAQISMEQMTEAIRSTVAPEQWSAGGPAKIQSLGNTLLISATPDMHSQITNLLDLFREHWGRRRTISIQTFWIQGSLTDAAELVNQEQQEALGAGVVDAKAWEAYLNQAKQASRIVFSATLTGHNNQTLHAVAGRQRFLTVDAEPLLNRSSSETILNGDEDDTTRHRADRRIVGFRPIQRTMHEGPLFQATPLATRGGNFVILDIHARLNRAASFAEGQETQPLKTVKESGFDGAEIALDRGDYYSSRFSSTLRCPKEQVVLAGAMTAGQLEGGEDKNLLLFVKATVHTIQEDESDWKQSTTDSADETETASAAEEESN